MGTGLTGSRHPGGPYQGVTLRVPRRRPNPPREHVFQDHKFCHARNSLKLKEYRNCPETFEMTPARMSRLSCKSGGPGHCATGGHKVPWARASGETLPGNSPMLLCDAPKGFELWDFRKCIDYFEMTNAGRGLPLYCATWGGEHGNPWAAASRWILPMSSLNGVLGELPNPWSRARFLRS